MAQMKRMTMVAATYMADLYVNIKDDDNVSLYVQIT